MDEKQKPVCGLCQRHQKLETVDGMAFWIEWDENGRPRLCMDSTTAGGRHTNAAALDRKSVV